MSLKKVSSGWGYSLVGQYLSSMHKALGSIPSKAKKKKKKKH
jgi:hypothetical protein